MAPLYIFDLDGTLALIDHRRHLVEGDKPNWPAFFAACVDDAPNTPVIQTYLRLAASGADCWVWSGRSDEVREQTEQWLVKNQIFPSRPPGSMPYLNFLKMRPAGNHTRDEKLKAAWLDALHPTHKERLVAVFDDRDKVVSMWRSRGVACFQVAPGAF